MSDEYLWDRSGEPDADELWLERKMPALRPAVRALRPIAVGAVYGAFRQRASAVPSVPTSGEHVPAMPAEAPKRSLMGFQAAITVAALAAGIALGYYGFGNRLRTEPAAESLADKPKAPSSPAALADREAVGNGDEQRTVIRGFPMDEQAPELRDGQPHDRLDGADIQRTVGTYTSSVRRSCWQPALDTRKPDAPRAARVNVTITVNEDGRVANVATSGRVEGYPDLAECIASRVRAWQFPASSGKTTVNVPFVFAAQ